MKKLFIILCVFVVFTDTQAGPISEIKLAILAFGTANWELTTIKNEELDKVYRFNLNIRQVASSQAAKIALQTDAVDLIISDWIWVSRQRATGSEFTFAPYSSTAGALIVDPNSNINSLRDLTDKRVGIAGGELDKNWLLLRALSQKQNQLDLDLSVHKVFGAAPLLNQQIQYGRLDAVVNYWHYAAQLEAKGYTRLLNGHQILKALGIQEVVPTLGYVFKKTWADKNMEVVTGFLHATRKAKDLLCTSDFKWQKIIPLTRTDDKKTHKQLRHDYCKGRVLQWGDKQKKAAEQIFSLLHQFGGERLTGSSSQITPGTFWDYEIGVSNQ